MQHRSNQSHATIVRVLITACSVFFLANISVAADKPGKAAIASAHPLATEAGLQIMREGGNAFDAAVAVAGALSVVEPTSSGLGGGGFFLLHRARDNFDTMVDAREVAPQAATRDMYLDKDGNVIRGLSTNSALAAGIPGEPAGLVYLAEKYGKLPLSKSLQPAIKLAEEGFPLYTRLRGSITQRQSMLSNSPAATVYLLNGKVPDEGAIIKQPELAQSLRLLARQGTKGFYSGTLAEKLVNGVRLLNGIWTMKDLADYRVKERKPVVGEYRGAKIISAPPPSSGGIALIDALNILSGFDLHAVDSATRKHLVIEAMRRVHRDRAQYLGDPDFVSIPVEQLIHPFYAAGQRTALRMDRAMPSDALPGVTDAPQGTQTTHFSVIDSNGNRVGATLSINFFFGSGIMIPGTGILLNNEMDDFSMKPGVPNGFQLVGAEANAIAPGKRMLSSMTPTFVETKEGVMVIGTPGGSRIIGMVLLGVLEWMDGKSAAEVVALPRFHHQYLPDMISYEANAFTAEEKAALIERGHKFSDRPLASYGNLQIVSWNKKTGEVTAASDPRGVGVGLVY